MRSSKISVKATGQFDQRNDSGKHLLRQAFLSQIDQFRDAAFLLKSPPASMTLRLETMNSGSFRSTLNRKQFLFGAAIVTLILSILFFKALHPDYVVFSNDGPLGPLKSEAFKQPSGYRGYWVDLHWLGMNGGVSPGVDSPTQRVPRERRSNACRFDHACVR